MKFPEFAKIVDGKGTEHVFRLVRKNGEARYYRDAGRWTINFRVVSGTTLVSVTDIEFLNDKVMIPCSHKEWKHNNAGYLE